MGVPRNPQVSGPYGDFGQFAALARATAATAAVATSNRSTRFVHPDPFIVRPPFAGTGPGNVTPCLTYSNVTCQRTADLS
jgi:hypothetical protein